MSNFPANPFWSEPTVDVGEPREDTNHEARAARLADELDAMRRERDAAREASAIAVAELNKMRLEAKTWRGRTEAACAERDQLRTDLLELRGIVRSALHGATDLERSLALSVLANMVCPEERTGLRLVGVTP